MNQQSNIAILFTIVLAWPACLHDRARAGEGVEIDEYTQQITIEFRDPDLARRAVVKIVPLFDDHKRAVSCRWDDNWTSDNETTRDLMEEYGIRGTWYLNDRNFSPENKPADYLPVATRLLSGGNSVGGHSLTHPFLTYFHNNRMFAEISGVRIVWEAALDKPVVSYAYSFIDLRPEPEGKTVLQRSLNTLQRAGYLHVAEYINFFDDIDLEQELSPIMPPENNSFDVFKEAIDWAYHDQRLTKSSPMITNSMHAWYGTHRLPYGYDELRKRFELLSSLDDVWHCNQNQYAAYRRQFRDTRLTDIKPLGNTLRVRLTRPTLIALNDQTPLTLSISGVPPGAIESVNCETAAVTKSERQLDDRQLFHLSHHSNQQLPVKIAHLANPNNQSTWDELPADLEFPNVRGAICVDQGQLNLILRCDDDQSLDDVRIVWRAPIGWRVDTMLQRCESIDRDGVTLSQPLLPVGERANRWGQTHFAAQVDFRCNGQPGRIHFTCQQPGETPDNSLPIDGFALLGPIPNDQWKTDRFIDCIVQGRECDDWRLADDSVVRWRAQAQDGYIDHSWLNPEYVRTMGTWDHYAPTYVIRSNVYSPSAQSARILTSHEAKRTVLVNGQLIESDLIRLRKGDNQLVIVYPGCSLGVETQRLAGCFVRLADPETGQRLRDVRYRTY